MEKWKAAQRYSLLHLWGTASLPTEIYKLGHHSQQTHSDCLEVQPGKIRNTVQNHMDFPRLLLSQRSLLCSFTAHECVTCRSKLFLITLSCGLVTTQVLSEHLQSSEDAPNFQHLLPQMVFQFLCSISILSKPLCCHLQPIMVLAVQSSVHTFDKSNKFWKEEWKKVRQVTKDRKHINCSCATLTLM